MAPPAYRQAVAVTQARLDEMVQRSGIARVRGLFRDLEHDLERSIARAVRTGGQFDAHVRRTLLLQVRASMVRLVGPFGQLVRTGAAETMAASLRTLAEQIRALDKVFLGAAQPLPLLEVARFRGLIDRRMTSLLIQHDRSVARYGVETIRQTESIMARGLATAEHTHRVVDQVQEAIDGSRWRAERIVRTELAWAGNATHSDGMVAQAAAMPDLWGRWSEHCDDASASPLDDRVAVDSVALHGQCARPGGMFTQPATTPVPTVDGDTVVPRGLVGKAWAHPPNRSNDRSVLVPLRESWGAEVLAWVWRDGMRVPLHSISHRRAA